MMVLVWEPLRGWNPHYFFPIQGKIRSVWLTANGQPYRWGASKNHDMITSVAFHCNIVVKDIYWGKLFLGSHETNIHQRSTESQWLHPVNFSGTPCELFQSSSGWKQRCLAQKCWVPTWLWSSNCGPGSGPIFPAPWNKCGFGLLPRGRHPGFTRWFNCE